MTGIPLSHIIIRERQYIPNFLLELCSYIDEKGKDTKSIFRLSAPKHTNLLEDIDTGTYDISKYSVHDAACALKKCLHMAPYGLINGQVYDACMTAIKSPEKKAIKDLKEVMGEGLPEVSYFILGRVLKTCDTLLPHKDITLMDAEAFAVCLSITYEMHLILAPTIMRSSGDSEALLEVYTTLYFSYFRQ